MTDESSEAVKIHYVPNGKLYVRKQGETICLSNGSLRYFTTECDAWAFLADCDAAVIDKFERS